VVNSFFLLFAACALAGCTSPETTRVRGQGPGGDVGNRPAVVKMHEALALRDAGVRKPVLLMGPFDERNLEDLIARDIMPMVYTPIGPVRFDVGYQLNPIPGLLVKGEPEARHWRAHVSIGQAF